MAEEVVDPLDEMRKERDRFAFDNARLQTTIGHLKEQVRGEQRAKEDALAKLETAKEGWNTTLRTKDALAQIADMSPEESESVIIKLTAKENLVVEVERAHLHARNLIARLDRDGGHRQAEDPSLEASVDRADKEIVRLQTLAESNETELMDRLRVYLASLTDEGREKFFYEIERGYCGSCGRALRPDDEFCQCTNDE